MAQSGYTPIITYYSNTTGNTPTSISLGELAVNVMDSKLFIGTGTNTFKTLVNPAGTTSITTLGTITTGVWNGTAIGNTYLANSTISGVSLGSNLANLTAGTNISFSSGTTYNGSSAITINATASPQVYPSAGIANSTGTAWGTSYSTTGSGTVVALATSPTFVTPILGTPTSGTLTNTTGFPAANLAGTALPSAIVTSSLTAVGTIATGVWNGTTIAIANGGTGQTTASAGFNALSPITTTGDLIIGNGTNSATRLAIGANTYVLTSNGTTASWQASSGGGGSAATPTALGTVYGSTSSGSPYLTALGYAAGGSNTGVSNTAIGYQAGTNTTSGIYNVSVGQGALQTNVTGNNNIAIGRNAVSSSTVSDNVGIGFNALGSTSTGASNVGVGSYALTANTTASNNTAVGYQSLYSNTTGTENVACGVIALYSNISGSQNCGFGRASLYDLTSGTQNIAMGYNSARNITTGSYGIFIGGSTYGSAVSDNYEIVIGYNTTGKGSSTGYINPNSGGVYQGNNSAAWSVTSDQRLKKNIVDNNVGLDKVIQIQVRNFEYRTEDEVTDLPKNQAIAKQGVQLGVIAQELQQVLPDCVKQESTGVLAVDSTDIMYHMINAIKELNAKITALESKVGA